MPYQDCCCRHSLSGLQIQQARLRCAEQAHAEMCNLDSRAARLQAVALGEAEPASLDDPMPTPSVPTMPDTRAVLHTIPPSDEHPGAILRLAGDR